MEEMTNVLDCLKTALMSIESQYYRLIILVNCKGINKQNVLSTLESGGETKLINLNLELSSKLLEYSIKQRPLKVAERVSDIIYSFPSTVLLDNIDILFEPSLKTDPLALLKSLSTNKSIIAFWNGALKDKKLYYAEPGFPEYISYPVREFVAIYAQPQDNFPA